ncbi:tRNA (adenosine(37)-N6)-threonylcarbamoyltransferase complex dimerization subunit type 1 TsaB [Candidatus Peregrinibacteria bacterium]|nr:tRNA (adenosine(37)-N6)-threonylcarbamoyltransferase complex dimerization subunit type 1 TsaB [Candidatus Peregrinibacteria bacterium]
MTTLTINTASSETSIALFDKNRLISEKTWPGKNDEAEKLMPAIESLLKNSKKTYKDLEKIIVVKGPGSFTGLRIGVTVANIIACLEKCRLFAVDSFEYWWTAGPEKAALLIFAGSGGVYVGLKPFDIPKLVKINDINQYLEENNVNNIFGDISEEQKNIINAKFIPIKQSFGKIMKNIVAKNLNPVKIVKPYYIKKPGITKSKKKII